MNKVKDLKNQRFGQLTVIGDYITIRNTRNRQERKWLCLCDCGTEKYILERSLLYGGTKSCGCLTRINSAKANAYDLHGKTFGELEVLNIAKDHPKDADPEWAANNPVEIIVSKTSASELNVTFLPDMT